MRRIHWDLERQTNSINAVEQDSVVGHRHLQSCSPDPD
jgi:hypothetical protein